MKKMVIALFTLSICLASGNIKKQMDDLMRSLQYKYQISGPEDLYKLKMQQTPQHGRVASRDMGDLVGDWRMEEEHMEVFVTVGSDQSIPDFMTLMAMAEAEGSITATASDYVAELTYILDSSIMEGGDGGDCDIYCEDEYNDYNDYGMEPSDIYCECCHEDWPLEDICEDGGDNLNLEFEGIADMNYARYGAAYATDGNMVYAICGADWDSEDESTVYHTHGERYNPGDDSWEMFGENLLQRCYTTAEYVNGSIYVFNGYNGNSASDTVEIINTTTGEVTYSATNPYPVWYGGSAVWNDKIYIFGGNNGSEVSNRLYEFDPTHESWTRLADMPDGTQTNGQVVNGILYTLGGYNGSAASSHINAYDIEQNTWETVGDMSVGISTHSVATDGEMIAVIGDYSNIEFCGIYDPYENEFFILDNNMEGRRHSASVYLDGSLYAYGGSQPEGFNGNEDYIVLSSAERAEIIDDERNYNALTFAQDYVNDNSSDWGEDTFDLESEYSLVVDGDYVSGGLGGDDPGNCEINWPEDPYKIAVYSFVSEYVLVEGGSVGCFLDDGDLNQTYADFVMGMEDEWTGGGGDDGFPECLLGCEGIENIDPEEDPYEACDWIVSNFGPDNFFNECANDCDDETINEISEIANICFECLNNENCDEVFDDDEDDDDGPDLLIMNMDLMEFFMISFGMDLDSLNIENPTVLAVGSSSDDDNIDMVIGMMFVETGVIELMADSEEAIAATSIDETSITITNLSLYNSTGTAILTVTGTIGPGWIDFEAGVETPINLFNEDGEGDDDMEFYLSLSEDSTGMDIEVGYDYYGGEYSDTSYFGWSATTDSLFLYFEGDDYYYYEDEADTMALGYMIIEDTLFASASFNPCEDDGYESYEECFGDGEFPGFDELVDVESFRVNQETVFTSTELASVESATILSVSDVPDDQGGRAYVTFARSIHDTDTLRMPEMYTVERLDGNTWVGLNSVSAYGNDVYVVEATTLADSTSETDALMTYRIIAAMEEGNFASDPMSGYSVDNIAPDAPASVVAAVSGGVVYLEWTDSDANDLDYYAVYRSTDPEFVPGEENMIGSSEDPEFADDVEELGDYYYAITTFDLHENESDPSELVNVTLLSLEDIRGLPEVFTLHQNYPNPFNPNTQIQYALPTDANVSIAIYDLVGRKIRTLVNEQVNAGYHSTLWNATNDMGSPVSAGVYIYTITANDFRDVKKMILLK